MFITGKYYNRNYGANNVGDYRTITFLGGGRYNVGGMYFNDEGMGISSTYIHFGVFNAIAIIGYNYIRFLDMNYCADFAHKNMLIIKNIHSELLSHKTFKHVSKLLDKIFYLIREMIPDVVKCSGINYKIGYIMVDTFTDNICISLTGLTVFTLGRVGSQYRIRVGNTLFMIPSNIHIDIDRAQFSNIKPIDVFNQISAAADKIEAQLKLKKYL